MSPLILSFSLILLLNTLFALGGAYIFTGAICFGGHFLFSSFYLKLTFYGAALIFLGFGVINSFKSPQPSFSVDNRIRIQKNWCSGQGDTWHRGISTSGKQIYFKSRKVWKKGSYLLATSEPSPVQLPLDATEENESILPKEVPLIEGMTTGGMVKRSEKEIFNNSGLSHLLAISGLHMSVVILLSFFAAAVIFRVLPQKYYFNKEKLEIVLSLLAIWFYWKINSSAISVSRAALMAIIYLLFTRWQGRGNIYNVAGIAFSAFLLVDPLVIYELSFQLSFAALGGILLLGKVGKSKISRYLLITLGASGATAPLIFHYFGQVNPFSLLLNIIIVPIFSFFIIPAGIVVNVVGGLNQTWRLAGFKLLKLPLQMILNLLVKINQLVPAWNPRDRFIIYWIFWLVLLVFALEISRKIKILLVLFGLVLVSFFSSGETGTRGMDMYFVSAKKGESILVKFETVTGQKNILIDAGAFEVLTLLQSLKIKTIHALYLSHFHRDHLQHLAKICRNFRVDNIYHNSSPFQFQLQEICPRVKSVLAPRELVLDKVRLFVLQGRKAPPVFSENNKSLVLLLKYRKFCVLFPGDLEKEGENLLLGKKYFNKDIKEICTERYLKVAHHGSNNSTSEQFINWFLPHSVYILGGKSVPLLMERFASKKIKFMWE
ncbi:MAG: ComEC/Rec2 family competence protein [Deltaproteobacteria bacterium]|jgi:competence protein ComEC|nr:ComEC/Rec2 family competence protein [Deltaproteobacteria bacterium]